MVTTGHRSRFPYRVTYLEDGHHATQPFTLKEDAIHFAQQHGGQVQNAMGDVIFNFAGTERPKPQPTAPITYDDNPEPIRAGCAGLLVSTVVTICFALFAEEAFAAVTVAVEAARFWLTR